MSGLQQKAVERVRTLSEDNLVFLLEVLDRLMPETEEKSAEQTAASRGIGLAKDEELYAEDFDLIYGGNDEIAEMFGVNG